MSPATCAAGDHSRHCGPLGTRQSFCCALSSVVSGRLLRLQAEPRQTALSCQSDAVGQRALRFEADDALDNIAAALDSLDQYGLARHALVVESRSVAEHLQPTANRPVPQHQTASLPHSRRTPAAQGAPDGPRDGQQLHRARRMRFRRRTHKSVACQPDPSHASRRRSRILASGDLCACVRWLDDPARRALSNAGFSEGRVPFVDTVNAPNCDFKTTYDSL